MPHCWMSSERMRRIEFVVLPGHLTGCRAQAQHDYEIRKSTTTRRVMSLVEVADVGPRKSRDLFFVRCRQGEHGMITV